MIADKELTKKICDLGSFIKYLEKTSPDDWAVDVVRTQDGKNCLLGHLIDYVYGKGYEGNIMSAWDFFGEIWATEYMYYAVNDGKHPKYQQQTAKERVIAYLNNLLDGSEMNTRQLMEAA